MSTPVDSVILRDTDARVCVVRELPKRGPVAQLGARFHGMEEVVSSNLTRSTKTFQRLTTKRSIGTTPVVPVWCPKRIGRLGQQPDSHRAHTDHAPVARLGSTAGWAACFASILSLRKTARAYTGCRPRFRVLPGEKLPRVEPIAHFSTVREKKRWSGGHPLRMAHLKQNGVNL